MVTLGYYENPENSHRSGSNINSSVAGYNYTSRDAENRLMTNTEFPKLNKTITSETLYSLKSAANSSPHSRILQSLDKLKKKPKKLTLETHNMMRESPSQKEPIAKNIPKYNPTQYNRNKNNNSKQSYEITTIEESEENSTKGLPKNQKTPARMGISKSLVKHNHKYNSINPDVGRQVQNIDVDIPSTSPSETEHHQNNFKKLKGSIESSQTYNSTLDHRILQDSERLQSIRPVLPTIKSNLSIPGMTTQNGTFVPYTYTVRIFT
jgi:hypothetical protein